MSNLFFRNEEQLSNLLLSKLQQDGITLVSDSDRHHPSTCYYILTDAIFEPIEMQSQSTQTMIINTVLSDLRKMISKNTSLLSFNVSTRAYRRLRSDLSMPLYPSDEEEKVYEDYHIAWTTADESQ